jgi:ribosome-binding ATPase YchF (GTP1/OBG family)
VEVTLLQLVEMSRKGLLRVEGGDYVLQEDDVVHFPA